MSDLIKMYKPNGQEIMIHRDSFAYATELGWSKSNPKKAAPKKKVAKKET